MVKTDQSQTRVRQNIANAALDFLLPSSWVVARGPVKPDSDTLNKAAIGPPDPGRADFVERALVLAMRFSDAGSSKSWPADTLAA
jgi:hypothetical protein